MSPSLSLSASVSASPALSPSPPSSSKPTFSRPLIAYLITRGHVLIIHHTLIYRLNAFLPHHPGGALPVLHFVGRDASDEIEAYHATSVIKSKMSGFVVGTIEQEEGDGDGGEKKEWTPLVPPIHLGWAGDESAYSTRGPAGVEEGLTVEPLSVSIARFHALNSSSPPIVPKPFIPLGPALVPSSLEPLPIDEKHLGSHERQLSIARSFRKMKEQVMQVDGGRLFKCDPWLYASTGARCAVLLGAAAALYVLGRARELEQGMQWGLKWEWAASAVCLGWFMHQIMFVAHDAGHTEITGDRNTDRLIGGFIASYLSGMSLGWWIDQHDVHHLVPNHPEHDPDIQLLPFFAFTTRAFDSLYSTFHKMVMRFDAPSRFLVGIQHWTFYPVMVVARFSLFGKSYYYLINKAKPDFFRTYEMVGVLVFWTWYTFLLKGLSSGMGDSLVAIWSARVLYTLLVLIAVCPIHIQIVLSHSAQSSLDLGPYESFPSRQLRTTMDVSCPAYLDFIHGGLQMQITHHLFPRLPRMHLREATGWVKEWAKREGVEFREKGFREGERQMLGMLGEVAGQWRAMRDAAREVGEKGWGDGW